MYEIQTERYGFSVRFRGVIGSEDLQKSCDEIEKLEGVPGISPDRLFDLSLVDATLFSYDVIAELARRRRAALLKNRVKSAVYAPTDLQFGYSRMFQELNDNPQIAVRVFRDLVAAEKWLEP